MYISKSIFIKKMQIQRMKISFLHNLNPLRPGGHPKEKNYETYNRSARVQV